MFSSFVVGAQYMAGTVILSPPGAGRINWIERAIQPSIHDPFFKQTAPAGKWIWWTVAQHTDVPGERYEYILYGCEHGESHLPLRGTFWPAGCNGRRAGPMHATSEGTVNLAPPMKRQIEEGGVV